MKLYNLFAFVAVAGACLTSCSDDIVLGSEDDSRYQPASSDEMIYVTDAQGKRTYSTLEFNQSGSMTLQLNATTAAKRECKVTFTYDTAALDEYNTAQGTAYTAFPQNCVTLSDSGVVTLAAGSNVSAPITVNVTSSSSLSSDVTYVIPLRVSVTGGDATLGDLDTTRLIFVKDLTTLPDCTKTGIDANGNTVKGATIFSCMEVNDTNPLNNLSFKLASTGKYLFDAVILFSANINYNSETGRVYVSLNENVQAILDNRDKYIKPLQDHGMKVILGILGNHDRSAITNLADDTARDFAREIKALCDAYNLDGVFYDDEYSSPITPAPEGFVTPSKEAASRLMYEVKKIQPERWNVVYVYGNISSLTAVDGVQPGDFIDFALHDYGRGYDLTDNYPGLPKYNMGMGSQELNYGYYQTEETLKGYWDKGYGSHMVFALDQSRSNFQSRQMTALQNVAKAYFNDDVVYDGNFYSKDW